MSAEPIDKLASLVKKLGKKIAEPAGVSASDLFPDARLIDDPITNEIVVSMLLWESSIAHATKAFEGIRSDLVDLNELRVCTPDELMPILGVRMPRSSERVLRLLSILNTIYDRENTLTLAHIREMNKRDVLAYLTGIDGLPQFAIARVLLFALGLHAVPLDERIAKKLVGESVLEPGQTLDQQCSSLERMVRASDASETYTLLEHWAQESRSQTRTKKSKKTPATKGATP
jgi:hypothetical protein